MTQATSLRRGWTTGSCATAAAKAAWSLLMTGDCPDPVTITLPGGKEAAFSLDGSGREGPSTWHALSRMQEMTRTSLMVRLSPLMSRLPLQEAASCFGPGPA